MLRMIKHGEVLFFEVEEVKGRKIEVKKDYYVVGESETHGNDHRIKYAEDLVELYMTEEDKLFIKTLGTKIYCPNKTRHDTINLPAGKWQVGHAQEYDYFTERKNRVRD